MDEFEKPLTLQEVLERLKGLIGRTKLLSHLSAYPTYNGEPTHRRWGSRIIFYRDDYQRLLASLERPSASLSKREWITHAPPLPSAEKAYLRAMKLLAKKNTKARRPTKR